MATNFGDIEVVLRANSSAFVRGLKQAEVALDRASSRFKSLGENFSQIGGALTRTVTAPLALAAGGAVKLAADFETSFAKIGSLTGVAADQIGALRAGVLSLAPLVGQGPQQLADALLVIT